MLYTWLTNVLNRQHGADEEVRGLFEFRESTVAIELTLIVYEQLASQGGPARPVMPCHRLNVFENGYACRGRPHGNIKLHLHLPNIFIISASVILVVGNFVASSWSIALPSLYMDATASAKP